jgi:hypothetical protein
MACGILQGTISTFTTKGSKTKKLQSGQPNSRLPSSDFNPLALEMDI